MKTTLILLLLLALHAAIAKGESEAITLESNEGKSISAVILSIGETSLQIRKSNGKEYEVPFSRLTEASVAAARKALEKEPATQPGEVEKAEEEVEPKPEEEEDPDLGPPPPKTLPPIEKDAKHPKGVNLRMMTDDVSYGYSEKNPILVGSKVEHGGPDAQQAYLASLMDATGERVSFERLGSGGLGPAGNILDMYKVTISTGETVMLWLDMYHPKMEPAKQPAPVGFYKKR